MPATMTTPTLMELPVAQLTLDPRVQQRVALDDAKVVEYAHLYEEGHDLGYLVVFSDGQTHLLADGFHRVAAATDTGLVTLPVEVHETTSEECLRAAILHATGCNLHGKPLTNADKRKRVQTLLDDAEWSLWSDNTIAKHCGVSQPFVSEVRRSLRTVLSENETSKSQTRQYVNKHGQVTTMQVGEIGSRNGASTCAICEKPIWTSASLARGIGPVCACKGTPGVNGSVSTGTAVPLSPAENDAGDEQAATPPSPMVDGGEMLLDWMRTVLTTLEPLTPLVGMPAHYPWPPATPATATAWIGELVQACLVRLTPEPVPDEIPAPPSGVEPPAPEPSARAATYGKLPGKVLAGLAVHGTQGVMAAVLAQEIGSTKNQVWACLEKLVKQRKVVKTGKEYRVVEVAPGVAPVAV